MYPSLGLLLEDYTEDDLPDAITLNGVSKSRSGSSYGNTTDGVIYESGVWAVYVGGVRSTRSCLITGDGNLTPGDDLVEDQFAAEMNVFNPYWLFTNLNSVANLPVVRTSLCRWATLEPVVPPEVQSSIGQYEPIYFVGGAVLYYSNDTETGGCAEAKMFRLRALIAYANSSGAFFSDGDHFDVYVRGAASPHKTPEGVYFWEGCEGVDPSIAVVTTN